MKGTWNAIKFDIKSEHKVFNNCLSHTTGRHGSIIGIK